MKQADFRGQRGAYHLNCHRCGVDIHLKSWESYEDSPNPKHCPYCGSTDIWYADETMRSPVSQN